jgi:Repair protein Rad1/Rec1/Rad17
LGTHNLDKTKLCFSYNITKEIFKMELLEESGVLSTAAIPGMLPPDDDLGSDSLALAFRSSPIAARIIVKSETLQELVSELELVAGGTTATVGLGMEGLEMNVVGHLGECTILLPVKGSHVVSVELPPSTTPPARAYPLHALTESMRGLDIAEETCITMNNAGMMAIQHQVFDRTLSDSPSFVDFILCWLLEEEDDEQSEPVAATHENTSPRSMAWSQSQDGASATTTIATRKSRVVSHKKMFPYDCDDDKEEDSKTRSDESSHYQTSASEARLFGSVVAEESQQSPPSSRASSRKVRRRTRRPLKKRSRAIDKTSNSDSEGSRNLLAGSDDDDENMEETEPLDVTALASPPRNKRDHREDECSSPELVYGQQHWAETGMAGAL